MSATSPFGLLEVFGIEIEYAIADAKTLDPAPYADWLLTEVTGVPRACDYEDGNIGWSNELVNHVLEFKNIHPVKDVFGLLDRFQANVRHANRILSERQCRLLPAGMHPWMRPHHEARIWPFEANEIYSTYDRIFNCRRHGWANVQSVQVNVSFRGDLEFAKLHAACRLMLPLTPAIAAASPFTEGAFSGSLANRLHHYRNNSKIIPLITGRVIPEPIYDEATYRKSIFEPLFEAIAPYDPDRHLRQLFLNARGAIPRFDRGAIELRLADAQECPLADLSVSLGLIAGLRYLIQESPLNMKELSAFPVEPLSNLLDEAARVGPDALVQDDALARAFGVTPKPGLKLSDLWHSILASSSASGSYLDPQCEKALRFILEEGTLASRIVRAAGKTPSLEELRKVYEQLADCLEAGNQFQP
jgi:gamma-glutamyl:cysteine ligase YbdK (ATP-grasp superfamily)